MLFRPGNRYFAEHRKLYVKAGGAELGNLGIAAWLLLQKIIGRKTQHAQSLAFIALMQALQGLVLRREAALRRHINDQQHLPPVVTQLGFIAFDGSHVNVIQIFGHEYPLRMSTSFQPKRQYN